VVPEKDRDAGAIVAPQSGNNSIISISWLFDFTVFVMDDYSEHKFAEDAAHAHDKCYYMKPPK
jgi:hypothetical protein